MKHKNSERSGDSYSDQAQTAFHPFFLSLNHRRKSVSTFRSSVQYILYALEKAHIRSTPFLIGFHCIAFETVAVLVWLTTALFGPSQRRSQSACPFYASLLRATDAVVSLELCSQVAFQASQHFCSSKTQATCDGCFARSFPLTPACSGEHIHRGLRGGCQSSRKSRQWRPNRIQETGTVTLPTWPPKRTV